MKSNQNYLSFPLCTDRIIKNTVPILNIKSKRLAHTHRSTVPVAVAMFAAVVMLAMPFCMCCLKPDDGLPVR
jgi:hypothetical protein